MNPKLYLALMVLIGSVALPLQADETRHARLANNPFTRPEVLKPKPPPPPAPVVKPVLAAEEVELNLTATMVSPVRPMVVVDGELLGIGDRIEGMKLIAVMEGKAVFSRGGRKFSFEINQDRPTQRAGN